jgi:hypothetical protein
MTNMKIWTKCYSRKISSYGRFLYFRRTRFDKDSDKDIAMVKSYAECCRVCPNRSNCSKPCGSPSDLLVGIEDSVVTEKQIA